MMKRIAELDGLRGLLALWVVIYHLCGTLPQVKIAITNHFPIFMEAWFAVDVFFMMSGFVMMHVYGNVFSIDLSFFNFKNFILARFARLYPVHIASLFALFVLMIWGLIHNPDFYTVNGRYSIGTLLGSIFLIQAPWFDLRSWNYPNWSISAEWHAYLIFPFLVSLIIKMNNKTAVFLLSALLFSVLSIYFFDVSNERYPTNGALVLVRAIFLFVSGMFFYKLFREGAVVSNSFALFLLIILCGALSISEYAFVCVLLVPFLLYVSLHNRFFSKILRVAPLLWLGKISYSLYMTHAVVQAILLGFLMNFLRKSFMINIAELSLQIQFSYYIISVLFSVFIGHLVCIYFEIPSRKYLMKHH